MNISKASPFLGVKISNLSYDELIDPNNLQTLQTLFTDNHLLIIENLTINKSQFIDIANVFAHPVLSIVPKNRLEDYPLITKHTNETDTNNKPLGIVAPDRVFHSDSYFTDQPTYATLLYSIIAPEKGGETLFTNTEAAYQRLSSEMQQKIETLSATYKNAYLNRPPVKQPLVLNNPNGKKSLYVNTNRALGIEGLPTDQAKSLIEKLYQETCNQNYIYSHTWKEGDLLIWNNFTTQHAATNIQKPNIRKLYRILTTRKQETNNDFK